jgi:hypothetical protein
MGRISTVLRAITARRWGPASRAADIERVTVRGPHDREVKTISTDADLAAFRQMWSRMIEVEPELWSGADGNHLVISRNDYTSRWLYDPAGLLKSLAIWRSIWVAPLYRMPSADTFNRLLGIVPE